MRTAELARHVVTELEDIGELHLRALTSAHLGFALLHLGDTPRARVWCERALALFARGPGTHHEILPAVSGCAEVLAVAGEFDEARKQLQAITGVSRLAGDRDRGCLLSASRGDLPSTGTRAVRRYAHDWEVAERELEALAAVPRFMHYTDAGPEITEGDCCSITCACGCTKRFDIRRERGLASPSFDAGALARGRRGSIRHSTAWR